MKYLILFSVFSLSTMDSPKNVIAAIKHQRSRSYPLTDHDYFAHHRTPEITIDIPEIPNEEKDYKGKCCSPTKCIVTGSICTAIAGVMTAVITATVTLVVHFTTK